MPTFGTFIMGAIAAILGILIFACIWSIDEQKEPKDKILWGIATALLTIALSIIVAAIYLKG